MKYICLAVLFAGTALTAAPADFAGTWKLRFTGPNAPKTIGSIILDLKIEGNAVTGTARIGVWPGDAPITDGKVDGDHLTFTATGHLSSTTGIPTCQLDARLHGDEMILLLSAIKNAGGPLAPAPMTYEYKGKRL